ncbi:hypothetical protein BGX38DRAFT_1219675 [Terfezia claveryi]|nr:hypothetical protein BGX38DRAFT_1219675 [Terfezia claveryi]
MSNPDAIDLDIDSVHESNETPTNSVDNDIDIAEQMGFSSFGGPPKATYHYKDKGKKRSYSGGGGGGGMATGANMSGLGSGSRNGGIKVTGGSSYSSNVVMEEKIEILPPPTEGSPDSLSHSFGANQNQIPGLPAKPEFTGVPTPVLGVDEGGYIWDTLGHGQEHGQGDYGHHLGGHGGRGRGRARGRGRGGRGSGGGEDVVSFNPFISFTIDFSG